MSSPRPNLMPSITDLNEAVQCPAQSFSDPELAQAQVKRNSLGLPIGLGGNFALTYSLSKAGRNFAVRCFHRYVPDLEMRYRKISEFLQSSRIPGFVPFVYQPQGLRIRGQHFPLLKMEWVPGVTFGEYLENNFNSPTSIRMLQTRIRELGVFLEKARVAHGDFQNGNLLVKSDGTVALVDYDGLYVPGLPIGKGNEIGHANFQHPGRSHLNFGLEMDRFSLIVIDLSLEAIAIQPDLFKTFFNGENILLTKADFVDPFSSKPLAAMDALAGLHKRVEDFKMLCMSPVEAVPRLEDFLSGRASAKLSNAALVRLSQKTAQASVPHQASPAPSAASSAPVTHGPSWKVSTPFPVVSSDNLSVLEKMISSQVEIIGQICLVHEGKTRRRQRPFVHVVLNQTGLTAVQANLWSEGLAKLTKATTPNPSWVAKWVSLRGTIDPIYRNSMRGTRHISITVTDPACFEVLSDFEAKKRLQSQGAPSSMATSPTGAGSINRGLLQSTVMAQGKSGGQVLLDLGARLWKSALNYYPLILIGIVLMATRHSSHGGGQNLAASQVPTPTFAQTVPIKSVDRTEETARADCHNHSSSFNFLGCVSARTRAIRKIQELKLHPQFNQASIRCAEFQGRIGEEICIQRGLR